MAISFYNADVKFALSKKRALQGFIASQVLKANKKKIHLNYVFCSDEYLLAINKKFLRHDYYTDIITFPLAETEESLEAEIYISIDRVKENAGKLEVDFNEELCRVMFHGVLHLIGYKDKSKA